MFTGSYTRSKAHLLHISGVGIRPCPKVTNDEIKTFKKEQDVAETKKSSTKSSVSVPLYAIEEEYPLFLMGGLIYKGQPLINFITYSLDGPIFLKCVDTSGEYKDAEYLKGLFIKVIKEVGEDNVVQIINDNAPVCQ
ncbi:hypothetical protein EJ110_NYTH42544 [Nymphaea thermarum]|nr:hypothetical protein EJ110_NYTH42544 [Nymphaea thermarum]